MIASSFNHRSFRLAAALFAAASFAAPAWAAPLSDYIAQPMAARLVAGEELRRVAIERGEAAVEPAHGPPCR